MKRKVAIYVRPIEQGTSGSGSHLKFLLKHIIDQNDKYDIHLLYSVYKNIDQYEGVKKTKVSRNIFKAIFFLRKQKFDLIHFSPLTIYSPVFLGKSIKKVATVHGSAAMFLPKLFSKYRYWHDKYVRPLLFKKMDAIFTVSRASKKLLVENSGVNEGDVYVTYNAVENVFRKVGDKNYNEASCETPYIFHISKFSERKNPWTILEAFRKLVKMQSVNLVIAGSGWDNHAVRAFLKMNDIENKVFLEGFVDQDKLIQLYSYAELFVFPSLYEGFGMPNLEAMACESPVITSKAFAIPEIVGDAAILLEDSTDSQELSEKMYLILTNEKLRMEMVDKGLKQVEKYSWEVSAKQVLSVYDELLDDA